MNGQNLQPPAKGPLPSAAWLKALALLLLTLCLVLAANLQAQEPDSPPAEPPPPPPGSQGNLDSYLNPPILHRRQPKEVPSQPPDSFDSPPLDQVEISTVDADQRARDAGRADSLDRGVAPGASASGTGEREASGARDIDLRVGSATAVPAAPSLNSPEGTIDHNTPAYDWDIVDGASWYYLWVNDATNTPILRQWYQASDACGRNWCAVWPSLELPDGDYVWWVAGWNSEGIGAWSPGMNFTVVHSLPNDTRHFAPRAGTHESMPTYMWRFNPQATWYWLWINDAAGNLLHKAWYRAQTEYLNCNAYLERCSVTPPVTLALGDYTWWVKTWNSAGYGPWSSGTTFSYDLKPFQTYPEYPSARTCGDIVSFDWETEPVATWYLLYVEDSAGSPVIEQWFREETVCQDGICMTPFYDLANGDYDWWIQTWNGYGYGLQSFTEDFTMDSNCGFSSQFLGTAAGWQEHSGSWFITGGDWLTVDGLAGEWASVSYNKTFQDFDYRVRLWRNGGDSASGLVIRGTPDPLNINKEWDSGYAFYIAEGASGPRYSVWRIDSGVASALQPWTTTDAFSDTSAWNTLQVRVRPNVRMNFLINGKNVWDGHDLTYTSGKAGIKMYSNGIGDDRLWVDWAMQSDQSLFPDTGASIGETIAGSITPQQRAWNEAASANPRGSIERAPSPTD